MVSLEHICGTWSAAAHGCFPISSAFSSGSQVCDWAWEGDNTGAEPRSPQCSFYILWAPLLLFLTVNTCCSFSKTCPFKAAGACFAYT